MLQDNRSIGETRNVQCYGNLFFMLQYYCRIVETHNSQRYCSSAALLNPRILQYSCSILQFCNLFLRLGKETCSGQCYGNLFLSLGDGTSSVAVLQQDC